MMCVCVCMCVCVYVCVQASVQANVHKYQISFSSLSSKFDAGGQILFMLSSGITGIQISKLIKGDGNEQPYQAVSTFT